MSTGCSCCGGATSCAAAHTHNRPGLSAIAYRAGNHASFLDAMKLRLSSARLPALAGLQRRDMGDASVALLDAWAVTAEVLSFYSERIANEHYLRTATERRSVLELARLTGYRLRPGVAASVFLAYELEAHALPLTIPIGTRAQSIPAPGESMQTFETAEILEARVEWNALRPRLSQPQARTTQSLASDGVWLKGVATQLKVNDALLISLNDGAPVPYRVDSVRLDVPADRTWIGVRGWKAVAGKNQTVTLAPLGEAMLKLTAQPKPQPANALRLPRASGVAFATGSDVYPQLLQLLNPILRTNLYAALANAPLTSPVKLKVYALRTRAALFAHNAPNEPKFEPAPEPPGIVVLKDLVLPTLRNTWGTLVNPDLLPLPRIALDRVHDQIKPGSDSFIVIDRPEAETANKQKLPSHLGVHRVNGVDTRTMATSLGAALDVTLVTLNPKPGTGIDGEWLADLEKLEEVSGAVGHALNNTDILRGTRVYAQSEELALAEEPLDDPLCDDNDKTNEIELDGLYDGLKAGRWITISGERSDVAGVRNIAGSELAMLAAVRHGLKQLLGDDGKTLSDLPGDKIHTFITLAKPLAYCYRRADAILNANVVRATHGETRREVAGGGDPTQALQQFPLKQAPLTFVAAPTPSGVASTLSMWVNEVRWPEVVSLMQLGPSQRGYISRRDNEERTTVTFGDGAHGARLPGGQDNIRALYRSGIGKGGNVAAGQITLTTDKPQGVKGVLNPLRASGGAGPDTLEQARENAPLAVMALDRLVSVRDYADFARLFAGIGKAGAIVRPGAGGQAVEVTVAGIEDIPIDITSDLYRNLATALKRFGDPHMRVRLRIREALALVINAKVALLPDYAWESVAPRLRAALNAAFGFARAELGQDIFVSAIISTIGKVEGVAYANVSARVLDQAALVGGLFGVQGSSTAPAGSAAPPQTGPCAAMRIAVEAHQIAYLSPEVPDTLILELL